MTSGLGVDATLDGSGNITSGTTAQDMQQIFGGLYSPGVVSGGTVTTSVSAMTYTVAAGVAVVQMSTGLNIPIPVPAKTITAASVPASGARTDIIYAQQRTPAIDGDSDVVVDVASVLPPRSVALRTYTAPAGATNTNACTVTGSIDYAIPYGAGLGRLWYYQLTLNGTLPTNLTRYGQGTIHLPTDRMVTFKITSVLSANNASGFDNNAYCEYGFLPNFDNGDFVLWGTSGLHQAWASYNFEATVAMTAGTHTVNFGIRRNSGPGTGRAYYGTDSGGFGRRGIEFIIEDAGVIQ